MPLFRTYRGTLLWLRTFTPALSQPSLAAGRERRRESAENFARFLLQVVEFGHLRRAQARSAESESEENFAIFEAQVVDFEHSSGEPPGRR